MKEIIVRRMKTEEYSLLKEFTYMAIYVPHGVKMPPKSIVEQPALKIYYQDFGTEKGDICLVAESDNKIVGAVWTRIVNDFAHIDDDTPLKDEGFLSVSLSVQKENFAVKMYKRAGFEVVKDNGEELIMLKTYNAI